MALSVIAKQTISATTPLQSCWWQYSCKLN